MQPDSCSSALAEIAFSTPRNISGEAFAAAKTCLIDYLASCLCAIPGDVAATAEAVLPAYGAGRCGLAASSRTSSVHGSAFYHALIATAEDLDDSHRYASGMHMSASTFPAALALCEENPVSGRDFAAAIVAGYEVLGRIARSVDIPLRKRGFHATGAVGPFGAAMTAAALLKLSPAAIVDALGIAASGCGGIFAFLREGSASRHFHAGLAAGTGISAAFLARAGMRGPRAALEGGDGFFQAYAGEWNEEILLAPNDRPEILAVYHKLWSTCGHAIPAVSALREIRKEIGNRLGQIRSIEISGYKASAALDAPWTDVAAKARFSLPAITGIVLALGSAGVREMSADNLRRPDVRRIAGLVSVREDPELSAAYPRLRSGRVRILMDNGDRFEKLEEAPLGMPENPASPAMLEDKFRIAAERHFSPARTDEIVATVSKLDAVDDMREITRLLRREGNDSP